MDLRASRDRLSAQRTPEPTPSTSSHHLLVRVATERQFVEASLATEKFNGLQSRSRRLSSSNLNVLVGSSAFDLGHYLPFLSLSRHSDVSSRRQARSGPPRRIPSLPNSAPPTRVRIALKNRRAAELISLPLRIGAPGIAAGSLHCPHPTPKMAPSGPGAGPDEPLILLRN